MAAEVSRAEPSRPAVIKVFLIGSISQSRFR
jgi:hypothetical protein